MRGSTDDSRALVWVAAICVLALVLRIFVIVNTVESGIFADMQDYYDRAVHLVKTGTLWPDAFRVPLFPIVTAAIFKAFGESLVAVRVAQALLGAATVALTYVLARRVTSDRGARWAAFIVAIYPALLLYVVYLMAETLFTFFVVLALVLWSRERSRDAFFAGIVIGLATLTRSTGVAVLAGIGLTELLRLVWRRHDGALGLMTRAALLVAAFGLVLAPWILRNYTLYGRVIPIDTSSGFNALLGNYEGATGRHPGLPAVEAVAQRYWRDAGNDLERSDIGMEVARDFVAAQPATAAVLSVKKIGYLFGIEGREHAWGYSFHVQGRREPQTIWVWGIALIASFPIVMSLACIGLLRPGLSYSGAGLAIACTLLAVTLVHVASFGDSRFHLPWIPILAILAARAFAPSTYTPWTAGRQVLLAVVLVCVALAWIEQARELAAVLPRLASSPTPLRLPY